MQENYLKRIHFLRLEMKKKKLSAFLISDSRNLRYLCGFTGTNGRLFITNKRCVLITDARYFETAEKIGISYYDQSKGLKKLFNSYSSIAFESDDLSVKAFNAYKKAFPKIKWKGVSGILESLRRFKDEEDIKNIKKAVSISLKTLEEMKTYFRPGLSEDEAEWKLFNIAHKYGADGFSFPPIITFGTDTADIHHQKAKRKLRVGESILIDFGVLYNGYTSDMTRMFFQKKLSSFEQKIYSTVLLANQTVIQSIRFGMSFSDLDKIARDVIEKAGFLDYFPHSTGHGVGLNIHELPNVSENSNDFVQAGMVFTVEPGIYIPKKFGVRIEDMVYIKSNGSVEILTKYKKDEKDCFV